MVVVVVVYYFLGVIMQIEIMQDLITINILLYFHICIKDQFMFRPQINVSRHVCLNVKIQRPFFGSWG